MLSLNDLQQLIDFLVAQNNQEMKYWLPKDILSVLQNEEVSAYLWAYLNPAEMLQEAPDLKCLRSMSNTENLNLLTHSNSWGEDFNFDLFAFDKANIHIDSLVIGCSQIFSKFK
jgi:hypothetical protein